LKLYGWDTNANPTQKETVKGAHQVNGSMVERRENETWRWRLYHWPVYSEGIRLKGRKGEKETEKVKCFVQQSVSKILPPR